MAFPALTDVRMMIHHPSTSRDPKILVTGKDREYEEIRARFDSNSCTWELAYDDEDSLRAQVIEYLREHGETSATDAAAGLAKYRPNIVKELVRLENERRATSKKSGREVLYSLLEPEGPA